MKFLNLILFSLVLIFSSCKKENRIEDSSSDILEIENGLQPPYQVKGDSLIKFNLAERMEHYNVPGVSVAVVDNGKIKWAKGYGTANTTKGTKVDTNTIFQAASISKPLSALAVLKLVENGKLDLDKDVNNYLKDWKVPENEFTKNEKVTLRRLLTHTAGMTVHGFPGYKQTDTFPSVNQVLDAKGNTPRIYVDTIPGSIWRYSGGGYTVMQKIVEDVSGLSFEEYMDKNILPAIGMNNSTFQQPLPAEYQKNASAAYDQEGKMIDGMWHNYPEKAAAGLWTTPRDLVSYCIEVQEILAGKENGVLSQQSVDKMLTKHKDDWGLGPALQWEGDSLVFRHGGKNAGYTNNLISYANQGKAVVVMTNADNGGKLMGEIIRSVSSYYNWGLNDPEIVEVIEMDEEELNKFAGKYLLDFEVPDIENYVIDIEVKDNRLYVNDSNNGDTNVLSPIEKSKFVDLESGDEVVFNVTGNEVEITWNGRFQFQKIQ
ncbi:CubicO group peptidase (beta-lactamase class C family) [Christiangramia gaetbulicola]|uniref:CubicO group peptidase (Beta-lactamase class C family) n=1 Tax=Christiangramia gaetbulicola TaxID=703340 RepID=A0A2T6ALE8_9FLAO|nr:serine hydrolase domain-containing protein [Christiangramia gaetbulicola]PTX44653.1 CubicO group peptidase (beta-lactamase class C family) [Christiangramia gaetbulicola]